MHRPLAAAFAVLALLASAPAAFADGPMPGAAQGSLGVVSANGKARYLAVGSGLDTVVETVSTADGSLLGWTTLAGAWGIPAVTDGAGGAAGLSRDGKTLVLTTLGQTSITQVDLLNTNTLNVRDRFVLNGSFAYDAMSPGGTSIYFIQWVDMTNLNRYVVREYDLTTHALVPGSIADRTQKGWVMQGSPLTRTTSANGRWVYTLYQNPGGYPFIHALDTVRGVAHCIGLPYTGDQNGLSNLVLGLRAGGRTLDVHWKSGRPWLAVDTTSFRIVQVRSGAFPWLWCVGPPPPQNPRPRSPRRRCYSSSGAAAQRNASRRRVTRSGRRSVR
jgi:hypothetical protein